MEWKRSDQAFAGPDLFNLALAGGLAVVVACFSRRTAGRLG
ncbi:hypothetical protein [Pseudarthrobacter sp. lyk4-40-TYG-27]|nr:hypothetical protein [Pseudarthrobacter sp. lyk4-40-TYG-27]